MALVIAVLGVFGVLSFLVTQRTRELGIRIALGGTPGKVRRLVMARGLSLVVIGIALGLVGAALLTHSMSSLLYGITTTDPVTFIGVSVDESSGENLYLDAHVAYRRACLNAIEYLKKFGYSGEQAYLLLGSAPIEGRISGVVDIPNACCSLYLPTGIFDFDIRPTKEAPQTAPRGAAAHTG